MNEVRKTVLSCTEDKRLMLHENVRRGGMVDGCQDRKSYGLESFGKEKTNKNEVYGTMGKGETSFW